MGEGPRRDRRRICSTRSIIIQTEGPELSRGAESCDPVQLQRVNGTRNSPVRIVICYVSRINRDCGCGRGGQGDHGWGYARDRVSTHAGVRSGLKPSKALRFASIRQRICRQTGSPGEPRAICWRKTSTRSYIRQREGNELTSSIIADCPCLRVNFSCHD